MENKELKERFIDGKKDLSFSCSDPSKPIYE